MTVGNPTSADVAQLAGVSQVTVSRAFSGKGIVAKQTHRRIMAAANQLNYRPDPFASGLRGGRTGGIGIIWMFESPDNQIGIQLLQRLQAHGYAAYSAQYPLSGESVCPVLEEFARRRINALILQWESGRDSAELEQINRRLKAFPAVVAVLAEANPAIQADQVIHSRDHAIREVVDHFVARGRQRLAFATSLRNQDNTRKAGIFLAHCRKHGLEDHPQSLIDVKSRHSVVPLRHLEAFNASFRERIDVDAILCMADAGAMAATRLCQQRGVRVPEDVAVVGFNNVDSGLMWSPPLATVDRCADQTTAAIEQLLQERLEQPDRPWQHRTVPMRFLWRASAG